MKPFCLAVILGSLLLSSAAPTHAADADKKDAPAKEASKEAAKKPAKESPKAATIDITRLPQNVQRPIKVGITFILNSISSLDEKSGLFQAEVDLTFTWTNPDIAFNPKQVGQTLLILNEQETKDKLKTIWSPQITISNLEKIVSNQPSMTISYDGNAHYVQRIKAVFKMEPDLRSFPFDTQSLIFYLDADQNTTSEIKFVQDQVEVNKSGIRHGVKLDGWSLNRVDFENTIVRNANGSFYPRFEIKIIMKRISQIHIFAFAPLFLLFLAPTVLTLYNKKTLGERLTTWGASLLTLIATSFALNQKYPALSANSILPEMISIMMGFQFVMIFISLTFVNDSFTNKFKNPFLANAILHVLQWAVPASLILIIISRILLISSPI